jgi:hypothetical protein
VRLFVALDLPADARLALAGWAATAAPARVRPEAEHALHVTLAFLGERDRLHTAGALWLPPRRPGVLAVGLCAHAGLAA